MATNAHSTVVRGFVSMMTNVKSWLDKGEAFANARGMSEEALLSARLYPDMLPLTRQIQMVSDAAKAAGARLSGGAAPSFPDEETTLEQLRQRIDNTIDYLNSLNEADFAEADDRMVTVPIGPEQTMEFRGEDYLRGFAVPNFYFHCSVTFAILRHIGVEIGKRAYLAGA